MGLTQLYPMFSSISLARTFILNDLFVSSTARRRGVGSQLLSAAVDYAKKLGAVKLSLATEITNETAQGLYQSQGWQQDEQFLVYHLPLVS